MSAFSRGIGLALSQRAAFFVPKSIPLQPCSYTTSFSQAMRNSPILQAARNLQTSARLCAKSNKGPVGKAIQAGTVRSPSKYTPTPRSTPPASSQWKAGTSLATATQLAKAGQPTLLYESPSHFWFHFFSLAATTFSVCYALVYLNSYVVNAPQDLHWAVPYGYGLVCMAMAGMGIYFFQGTLRIVRRITAVPRDLVPKGALQAGNGIQSSAQKSPVVIEITMSQASKNLQREKKLYAEPSDVWLAIRMQDWVNKLADLEKTAPPTVRPDPVRDTHLDKAADGVTNMWKGAKRSLTKGGFVPIKIDGERYRLDVSAGAKVLGDGKQFDALIPCYPDRFDDGKLAKFLQE